MKRASNKIVAVAMKQEKELKNSKMYKGEGVSCICSMFIPSLWGGESHPPCKIPLKFYLLQALLFLHLQLRGTLPLCLSLSLSVDL